MPNAQVTGLGVDPSKLNPAEVEPEKIQEYQQSLKDQIGALEQRYKGPNWFKVAAGFAKPQLGGFTASLGSAADAMGDTVEQDREQQLPIAQMRAQLAQSNVLIGQNVKQNDIFQEWQKSGRPMDAATYTRITSLNPDSAVAKSATKYYEGSKAALDLKTDASSAMRKDPLLDLQEYAGFTLGPNANPEKAKEKYSAYVSSVEASKPPQISPEQWSALSIDQKTDAASKYAQAQREAGMSVEEKARVQADEAPNRLKLFKTIRTLALGNGIEDIKKPDGSVYSGQQQMSDLLNKFGGNNPMEVFARAAADGKLGDALSGLDQYARQAGMSPQAKDKFQVLAKTLAENQVAIRNSSLNPTDAAAQIQATATPGIQNSQGALVTLTDMLGNSEQNAIERYKFIKDKKVPYGMLNTNPEYLDLLRKSADEHTKIATSKPMAFTPSWFNPDASVVKQPQVQNQVQNKPTGNAPKVNTAFPSFSEVQAEIERRKSAKKP